MPTHILIILFIAALFHAIWNAMVKQNEDRLVLLLTIVFFYSLFGFITAFFLPLLNQEALIWLFFSAIAHLFYKIFLVQAYQYGDLSKVYPIARGFSPIIILVLSLILLQESYTVMQIFAVCITSLGIILLMFNSTGSLQNIHLKSIAYAFGVSFFIACYTLLDAGGAKAAVNPLSYIAWAFTSEFILFFIYVYYKKRKTLFSIAKKNWKFGLYGGCFSFFSYGFVIYASTTTKIVYVSNIRETSVLFASLIGIFILKEKLSLNRILAACLIAIGIMMIHSF